MPLYLLHKVDPGGPANNPNWMTPDRLEALLNRHKWVSLRDHILGDFHGAVLTFDGVYENVYQHAWPILKKRKIPFEMFVTFGVIGEGNEWDVKEPYARFASMHQLWAMTLGGLGRIQSHTVSHPNLTTISSEALAWELSNPFNCDFVAYPYGKHDERVRTAARAAGYKAGISVIDGSADDRWALTRKYG